MAEAEMSFDKLVKIFRKIKAARSELSADYKAKDDALKAQQDIIGNALLAKLNETDAKSVNTTSGIAYWQTKIIPRADDWQRFYDWVAENGAFDALERRIKSTFISEYMETHDGALPPGVSVLTEREIRVRSNNA